MAEQDTGIKVTDWHGKYWAGGGALQEAGFQPNQMQTAYADDHLIERFIDLLREVGRFPVRGELKLKARADRAFPSHNAFARLGPKRQLASRVLEYCKAQDGFDDVIELCAPVAEVQPEIALAEEIALSPQADASANTKDGYVYMALLKLRREKCYKIGKAVLVERRTDQISLQLPEDLGSCHTHGSCIRDRGILAQAICGETDKGRMVFIVSTGDRSLQAAKVHVRASSREPLGTRPIKLP